VIDLHSHVLPGLDDGAADLDESVAIARSLAGSGVRVLAATPHVRHDYPTTPAAMRSALARVREAVEEASIDLVLVPGGEIGVAQLPLLDLETRRAFTIGGDGRFLLLEFPPDDFPAQLAESVQALHDDGLVAILAHPERNPVVQAAPQRLAGLLDTGALIQVTAGSLTGAFGNAAAAAAHSLVDTGLVQLVASDSHHPLGRPTVADALAHLPRALAVWLTHDAPAAVLAGERPPAPPARGKRRLRR
jgi:protein-tyrosine phosphatase